MCRQLGYENATAAIRWLYLHPTSTPIWLNNVRCNGNEQRLVDCRHIGWSTRNCYYNKWPFNWYYNVAMANCSGNWNSSGYLSGWSRKYLQGVIYNFTVRRFTNCLKSMLCWQDLIYLHHFDNMKYFKHTMNNFPINVSIKNITIIRGVTCNPIHPPCISPCVFWCTKCELLDIQ